MGPSPLPEFGDPPLIEVAFGCAFNRIPLTSAHWGFFWERLGRPAFPTCIEAPPLEVVIEPLEGAAPSMEIQLSNVPPGPRLWFTSVTQDELVQVQQDRFHSNWRKLSVEKPYPRYAVVSEKFFQRLGLFDAFVEEHTGSRPTVRQFELTYINHLLPGEGVSDFSDLASVLSFIAPRAGTSSLPVPQSVEASFAYPLPNASGRLHARAQTAIHLGTKQKAIILELTARGISGDAKDWFATAHEAIVRSFTDLTASRMHSVWKRTR